MLESPDPIELSNTEEHSKKKVLTIYNQESHIKKVEINKKRKENETISIDT